MIKRLAITIISIIIVVLLSLFYLQQRSATSLQECSELKRNFCIYNNTIIYSNLDALIWIKNNIPSYSIVIAWQDYENELKNISSVKVALQLAFDLTLDNVTQFLCGAKHFNASYLFLTGMELSYTWYMRGSPIIQRFELMKINETEYASTDENIVLKSENQIWVPYTYYREESGGLKLSRNISKMKKIIYYENGELKIYKFYDSAIDWSIIISKDFSYGYLISPNTENSILIRLLLLDDKIEKFSKIYEKDNVKIYSLDTSFLSKDCYY